MATTSPERNKALALKAFDTLFNKRDYVAAEGCWSETYIRYNAHIPPGRNDLFNLVRGLPETLRYDNHVILAEGDYVIATGAFPAMVVPGHGSRPTPCVSRTASPPSTGTSFRTRRPNAESLSGLPMFGNRFPA